MAIRDDMIRYIREKYHSEPEHPWARWPDYMVFRHADSQKWFGLIMDLPGEKLGLAGRGNVEVLNVKTDDPLLADFLMQQDGYFPGYHFSRGSWVSILLDGTVPCEELCTRIDDSFLATAGAKKKQRLRPPKEWLIPANPKYYDVEHAFDTTDEIEWKQGAGIRAGDTVYLYVAAPVSAILFRCSVLQADIPFSHTAGRPRVSALIRVRLEKRYPPDAFPFARLKEEYGVFAVRGPRGVPHALSAALKK